ncbi:MAG: BrnA antitoxin family protein [Micrococcales bacterium]|nr:BrnA antitoxin family protein [Micrococcales bacterium]
MQDSDGYVVAADGTRITVEEFDRLFDEGEDITMYLDMDNARRPGLEQRTVAIDLPVGVLDAVALESGKTGTPVHGLIESWVEEKVDLASA